jgi:hypothetical protein
MAKLGKKLGKKTQLNPVLHIFPCLIRKMYDQDVEVQFNCRLSTSESEKY